MQLKDIQEIMNYRRALREAEEELKTRPFNLNLLLRLHSTLLNSVRGRNKGRGHFRDQQNWIGTPGSSIDDAHFVPRTRRRLSGCSSQLGVHYHMDSPDSLVQLAVIHAQFEILHPFLDGNGRLGRILIPLFLYEKGILSEPECFIYPSTSRQIATPTLNVFEPSASPKGHGIAGSAFF